MKKLHQERLAKLEGGLSAAAACGIAMGVAAVTGGWGIFAAVAFCLLTPSDLK
jgi:hypothetical protein